MFWTCRNGTFSNQEIDLCDGVNVHVTTASRLAPLGAESLGERRRAPTGLEPAMGLWFFGVEYFVHCIEQQKQEASMGTDAKKVCISGPTDRPWVEAELRAAGCEVVLGKSFEAFPEHFYQVEAFIDLIGDSDVLLVSTRERVPRSVMEGCPNLRAVIKASIGVENVDIQAATELGVLVCNSPVPENFIGLAEATIRTSLRRIYF